MSQKILQARTLPAPKNHKRWDIVDRVRAGILPPSAPRARELGRTFYALREQHSKFSRHAAH